MAVVVTPVLYCPASQLEHGPVFAVVVQAEAAFLPAAHVEQAVHEPWLAELAKFVPAVQAVHALVSLEDPDEHCAET